MRLGLPREIKTGETRVALTPAAVARLVAAGHACLVEREAGAAVGFSDADYLSAGAQIVASHDEVFAACELVVKVKELQPAEWPLLRPGLMVFGFQQLAPDPRLLGAVLESGVTCIAYETVEDDAGGMPILAPMSRIAGALAPQIGAQWLMRDPRRPLPGLSAAGILLPALDGRPGAAVTVLGAGSVGSAAAEVACGLGARVRVLARTARRLDALSARLPIEPILATPERIAEAVGASDLLIGGVLTPGQLSPTLVTRAMLRGMRPGSVLVDVGIDQRGIAETSRMTTLADPVYVEEGVIHYCVPNIPALVPRSAAEALSAAVEPFVELLARLGLEGACAARPGLASGVQTLAGEVTDARLARDTGRPVRERPFALARST